MGKKLKKLDIRDILREEFISLAKEKKNSRFNISKSKFNSIVQEEVSYALRILNEAAPQPGEAGAPPAYNPTDEDDGDEGGGPAPPRRGPSSPAIRDDVSDWSDAPTEASELNAYRQDKIDSVLGSNLGREAQAELIGQIANWVPRAGATAARVDPENSDDRARRRRPSYTSQADPPYKKGHKDPSKEGGIAKLQGLAGAPSSKDGKTTRSGNADPFGDGWWGPSSQTAIKAKWPNEMADNEISQDEFDAIVDTDRWAELVGNAGGGDAGYVPGG